MKFLLPLLFAVLATPALARADQMERPRAMVQFSDLDLRSPAGAMALRRRIDLAIVRLSGGGAATTDFRTRNMLAKDRARGRLQADCLIAAAARPRSAS